MSDPTAQIRAYAATAFTRVAALGSLAPHARAYRAAKDQFSALGAAPAGKAVDDPGGAWSHYLTALADQLELANAEMLDSYDMMRGVFQSMDVPFLQTADDPSGLGYPTAWTAEHDQTFINAHAMAEAAVRWLRETVAGQRVLMLQGDKWLIEQKPSDDFSVILDPKTRMPIMVAPAPQGLDGTLGVPAALAPIAAFHPVIIALGIIAAVAIQGGILYVLYRLVSGVIDIIRGIVDYQTTKKQYECLDNHTAEDCIKTQKGIVDLTKAINEGRDKPSDDPVGNAAKGLGGLLTTGLFVALGGALIYLGVKTVPPLLEEMQAKKKLRGAAA